MNPSPTLSTDPGVTEGLRQAYRQLSSEEKIKFVEFAARRRFTSDLFENWSRQSGVDAEELLRSVAGSGLTEPLRERLDATLLMEGNEALLIEAVMRYLPAMQPALLATVKKWAAEAKLSAGGAGAPEPPEELQRHPQGALMTEALRGGFLDQVLAQGGDLGAGDLTEPESPGKEEMMVANRNVGPAPTDPVSVPADKGAALEQLDELEELMDSVEFDIRRIRSAGGVVDLGALERKLRRASLLSLGVHRFVVERGSWEDAEGVRGVIEAIPDAHSVWANALADFLEEVPVNHPLRRKREEIEALRDAAISDLRNFADLGGVEEEVPGPAREVDAWWNWGMGLSDDAFPKLEDWCGVNSLDHLADFLAELWTLSRLSVASAPEAAASNRISREIKEDGAEAPRPAGIGVSGSSPASPNRDGALLAAMESARRQSSADLQGS
ncbi:MAG: hypothetical protein DVB23_002641 [Verrucomicrobia bacterium]|nr:MAG: hypothetical protein DVB23_002641 [Verrucomicrobiota bacterium]